MEDPPDLEERERWEPYQESYETALGRCSTEHAPWYVIPAEKKSFRNVLVSRLLVETLESTSPQYPRSAFDPAEFRPERLV